MDYDSLIASKGTPGSIANWVNFSDALLPLADILGDAQALIYDSLRVSYMRDIVDLTLPSGESVVAQPASTLQIIGIWDDQNSKLWAKDEVSLQNMRTVDEQAATVDLGRAFDESGIGEILEQLDVQLVGLAPAGIGERSVDVIAIEVAA